MDALDRGIKLVVVDPRRTQLAARADLHLQLRPGTDGALALGIAHVILEEGLHDAGFVAAHTQGFAEYRAYVRQFDPERVEGITGVPAEKIRAAARLYATTRPAALMFSAAPVVHHANGVQNSRAVFALIGLTGNFDVAGGNKVAPFSWLEIGGGGFVTRQHDFELPRALGRPPAACRRRPLPRLGRARRPGAGHGPAAADPHRRPVPAARAGRLRPQPPHVPGPGPLPRGRSQELDFICDVDLFATDASRYADIVLPACSSVERSEVRCYPEKYVTLTEPAIAPLGEARSDTDIVFDLARRLGLDDPLLNPAPDGEADPAATFAAALDWIFEPSGMTMAELAKHPGGMPVRDPLLTPDRQYLERGFPTPSGKMEFVSSVLERLGPQIGADALPTWRPPGQSAEADSGAGARLPVHPELRVAPADVHPLADLPALLDARPAARGRRPTSTRPTRGRSGIAQDDEIELDARRPAPSACSPTSRSSRSRASCTCTTATPTPT